MCRVFRPVYVPKRSNRPDDGFFLCEFRFQFSILVVQSEYPLFQIEKRVEGIAYDFLQLVILRILREVARVLQRSDGRAYDLNNGCSGAPSED
jgi:hypothetical protein